MKKTLQGIVAGLLIGSIGTCGIAYAKSGMETITVQYDNIKVYKDNVLCDLKDANGKKVEPFIYNGTTYLPLRGAANLADLGVTWDGKTKSVHLWDEMTASETYLMEVCPPYETTLKKVLQSEGQSFQMSGQRYSNGIDALAVNSEKGYALFNLNGQYSSMEFTYGHIDNSKLHDAILAFYVDGELVEEIDVPAEGLPQTTSVPLNHGLQLKIMAYTEKYNIWEPHIGIANIIVK